MARDCLKDSSNKMSMLIWRLFHSRIVLGKKEYRLTSVTKHLKMTKLVIMPGSSTGVCWRKKILRWEYQMIPCIKRIRE